MCRRLGLYCFAVGSGGGDGAKSKSVVPLSSSLDSLWCGGARRRGAGGGDMLAVTNKVICDDQLNLWRVRQQQRLYPRVLPTMLLALSGDGRPSHTAQSVLFSKQNMRRVCTFCSVTETRQVGSLYSNNTRRVAPRHRLL